VSAVPLDEHALLSDCGSAALVTAAGSVDWLCLPRFDSPPVLGRLLDESAGYFLLAPQTEGFAAVWRYRPPGLVLETTWSAPAEELVVIDAMAMGPHERGPDLGRSAPGVLLRQARCTRGSVSVRVEYAPRPELGLIHPRLATADGAIVSHGGATVGILSTEVAMDLADATASATVTLTEGQELVFAVAQCDPWGPIPSPWSERQIRRRLKATEAAWQSWSSLHQRYEGPLQELVHHSGVVLQGLTYARSGAMVAAPTWGAARRGSGPGPRSGRWEHRRLRSSHKSHVVIRFAY